MNCPWFEDFTNILLISLHSFPGIENQWHGTTRLSCEWVGNVVNSVFVIISPYGGYYGFVFVVPAAASAAAADFLVSAITLQRLVGLI